MEHKWKFRFKYIWGGATVSCYYGGSVIPSFSFSIRGQNPSEASVKGALGTNPWFVQRIAKLESSYRQFGNDNDPLFGPPHGFGIMQLDPPGGSQNIWNWTSNVDAGRAIINAFQAGSYEFWTTQQVQFETWNSQHQANPVAQPADDPEGNVIFSYSPTGANKSFADAIWIKQYNGAPSGHYLVWQNGSGHEDAPFWEYHKCETVVIKGVPQTICYVNLVCSIVQ
jgi:hypothetical protein